jgi:two-component system catabolic regulation response regulator CreB
VLDQSKKQSLTKYHAKLRHYRNVGKTMTKSILIVEDEHSIADTIIHSVEREGYAAVWCSRGTDALDQIKKGAYALAILDIGLPDINGFELCKAIRAVSAIPLIFLTARDEEVDKIVGLEIGADDYITKPFSPRELGARIRTVLRRYTPHEAERTVRETPPSLTVDSEKRQVVYRETRLELTRYEFELLALFAASPGRVYSREELMGAVWDDDSPSLDRTVDTHIKSLRAKFRAIDPSADPILTYRGSGYALRDDL